MQKNSIALSLIGYDELFDEAMAIGFSNWGLGEHIGQAGSSFAYYKLSHVWLAPILELSHSSPMIISTSIMPLIVFMFIGISMWAASYQIFRSSTPAGIASVLFFLQSSLPEPDNLAIRVAQCLVIVYLLTGLIALMKAWNCIFQESLVVLFVFFVLISTRLQFGIIVLSGFLLFKILLFFRSKLSFRRSVLVIAAVVLSLVSSFFIFFNEPAHVVGTPNQNSNFALIGLLISFVGVRSIIPLLVIKRDNNQLDFLIVIIVSSVIIFFLIPLSILSTSPSLTIALLVSVLISNDIRKIKDSLTKVVSVSIFVLFSTLGFLLRLFYDLFKWVDSADIGILLKPFVIVATDGNYLAFFATAPFVVLTVLFLVSLRITRQQFRWRPIVLLTALSMSFGISVAATYRSVTNHYRYGMDLADKIEPNSPMAWYVDTDRLDALKWMRENTHRDEIFGQNTSRPDYWDTAYSASLILSGSIHRRAFIESTYLGELQREFPRHVSHQTDRQRKELLRFNTSFRFPITPNETMLKILQSYKVKWFVVDLGNTELRDWEPWATTRFMNEKVAILELAQGPVPSD